MAEQKQTKTDEELALSVQHGDKELFGELITRYEDKMLRYASRFLQSPQERQDIVQDIFLKSYSAIQSFDSNRKFSSWLYRIAHNEIVNLLKKNSRSPLNFFDPETFFPHPVSHEMPERDLEKKEIEHLVAGSLKELDYKYKEVLVLYYIEDMDYNDISEILKIPVSTVGVRLGRGREKLKQLIGGKQ